MIFSYLLYYKYSIGITGLAFITFLLAHPLFLFFLYFEPFLSLNTPLSLFFLLGIFFDLRFDDLLIFYFPLLLHLIINFTELVGNDYRFNNIGIFHLVFFLFFYALSLFIFFFSALSALWAAVWFRLGFVFLWVWGLLRFFVVFAVDFSEVDQKVFEDVLPGDDDIFGFEVFLDLFDVFGDTVFGFGVLGVLFEDLENDFFLFFLCFLYR
jgi:hypothetical protein